MRLRKIMTSPTTTGNTAKSKKVLVWKCPKRTTKDQLQTMPN